MENYQRGLKIKDIESNQGQMAQSYAKYQFVNIGNFAMNQMDLLTGWVDIAKVFGVTSPDYRVFVLDDKTQNAEYLLKLLQLCYSQSIFYGLGHGAASEGRWRLPRKEFLNFPLPLPPRSEQDQIVRYLDWKVSQINKLINAKRRQIALLQEQIDLLTNQAIAHPQNNKRLKHIVEILRNWIVRNDNAIYSPVGVLNRGRGIFHKTQLQGVDLGESEFFEVKPNSLMFSGQFAWEGAVAITSNQEANCIASHRYYMIRGIDNVCETEYLWAFYQTKFGDLLLNDCSHGAAGRNKPLNFDELLNEYVPMPSISLQQEIARQVRLFLSYRESVKKFEAFVAEYSTRLVSDVVTGKLDVRGVVVPKYEAVENAIDVEGELFDEEEFVETNEV